jgi:hypothetical protein
MTSICLDMNPFNSVFCPIKFYHERNHFVYIRFGVQRMVQDICTLKPDYWKAREYQFNSMDILILGGGGGNEVVKLTETFM